MKNSKFLVGALVLNIALSFLHAEPLVFSSAYDLALQNSNGIKAQVYSSQADDEKINQEESQLYPQIKLSGYYKKSEYTYNDTARDTIRQGLFNATATLQQSVYNAEVYSRINTQEARSEYSKFGVKVKKEELAQEVFGSYLNLLKSKNKIKLYESYLSFNKAKLQELTRKYELNLSNKMDLLEVKVDYNAAQIDLDREKKLYNVYDLKLKQYIGDVDYELPTIDSDKSILDMIDTMKETVGNDKESLKVKQAQVAIDISKGEMEIASDGHLPTVNLAGSYAKFDTDDPTIDAPYDSTKYLMLTVDIPIYSGGYVSSRVASSELLHKAAQEDLLRTKKEVRVEYNEYLALFEASVDSVAMYKEALESAELYVESVDQGYDHGLKSIVDLSDAKVRYFEVRYKYIENIYELVDSYIGLLIVTNSFGNIDILDRLVQ